MSEQSGEPDQEVPGGQAGPQPETGGDTAEAEGSESLEAALAAAEARAEEHWNKYLRSVAELDNMRKRLAREVDSARRAGIEKAAAEFLPVADSLELALESAAGVADEGLLEGQQATLRLLLSALQRLEIEQIDPCGAPFDPQLHEAMSMQPAGEAVPGSVLAVLQKGYRLGERLLRPARVVVAGEPDTH
ncbi:MAG: nucleotide exchange factor GrpE [Chromatiales bacterium]|nr:nucleotide exchange factor GrpE [Chromatiales bacterium]